MYFVLLKEKKNKKAINLCHALKTKQQLMKKGQSQKAFTHFIVLFFLIAFDPPQKCRFSLIPFLSGVMLH